jgi:hypothetical protein
MIKRLSVASFMLLIAGTCQAQPAGISTKGPLTGIILDERTGTLRPINGLLGSTLLGSPLAVPFPVRKAAINAQLDFALVVRDDDSAGVYVVRNLLRGTLAAERLEIESVGISSILLTEDGTGAVVYFKTGASLQRIIGLPSNPSVSEGVSIAGFGNILSLAIDQDAISALLVVEGEAGTELTRMALTEGRSAAPIHIVGVERPRAVASSTQGFVVAGVSGTVHRLDKTGQQLQLSGPASDLSEPMALCAGSSSVIGVIAQSNIALWSSDAAISRTVIPLDWKVDRCEPLGANRFLLNSPGSGPLQVLDLNQDAAVYLTPADRVEAN